MIEKKFDISFIADLALREKQIQQNYRPIIAVHKWFARRPGTLFRGLLLSEFLDSPLRDVFYEANNLSGYHIADPFMGGGTPIIEANRIGCDVTGFDINPMSYWIVKQEIEHLNLDDYTKAAKDLRTILEKEIGHFYRTGCVLCGADDTHVKYFLWVKVVSCHECGKDVDLFPVTDREPEHKAPEQQALPTGNEHILFVDDEEALTEFGKDLLEDLGYTVETRSSGADALEAVRMHPGRFALLITDMIMPGMAGDKLATEIKKIQPDIRVILCTGLSALPAADHLERAGIQRILMKPVTVRGLADAVREILDGRP